MGIVGSVKAAQVTGFLVLAFGLAGYMAHQVRQLRQEQDPEERDLLWYRAAQVGAALLGAVLALGVVASH